MLIHLYQWVLGPILGGACRFHPSCSEYAKAAFQDYPPEEAIPLTICRLSQCRPFGPFGYDPIPAKRNTHG